MTFFSGLWSRHCYWHNFHKCYLAKAWVEQCSSGYLICFGANRSCCWSSEFFFFGCKLYWEFRLTSFCGFLLTVLLKADGAFLGYLEIFLGPWMLGIWQLDLQTVAVSSSKRYPNFILEWASHKGMQAILMTFVIKETLLQSILAVVVGFCVLSPL